MSDRLLYDVRNGVAHVTFNRPAARNALTARMYEQLWQVCEAVDSDDAIRAMVLTGAGEAFVAGADIAEFRTFTDGADGVAYEERQLRNIARLATVRVPTVAAVRGYAVGGGMSIASVCDIRICTPDAQFGYPTARTLGNCLAVQGYALLMSMIGEARTKDIVMRARLMSASEALAAGYVSEVVDPENLMNRTDEIVTRLLANAPISMYVAKESIRRIREADLPSTVDLVELCYASDDFHEGVAAFGEKRKPHWVGR